MAVACRSVDASGAERRGGARRGDDRRTRSAGDAARSTGAGRGGAPGSTAEAAAVLRVAAGQDLAVVVRGAGTKLDWGAAARAGST